MARTGRPKKVIKQEQFEAMCQIQATQDEILLVLGVSDKTLNAWCKRTYGKTFSDIFAEKRKQWKLADRSAAMAIFLGKQFLGQKDQTEMELKAQVNNPFDGVSTDDIKKLIGHD